MPSFTEIPEQKAFEIIEALREQLVEICGDNSLFSMTWVCSLFRYTHSSHQPPFNVKPLVRLNERELFTRFDARLVKEMSAMEMIRIAAPNDEQVVSSTLICRCIACKYTRYLVLITVLILHFCALFQKLNDKMDFFNFLPRVISISNFNIRKTLELHT